VCNIEEGLKIGEKLEIFSGIVVSQVREVIDLGNKIGMRNSLASCRFNLLPKLHKEGIKVKQLIVDT
jgi:hypothetical protein